MGLVGLGGLLRPVRLRLGPAAGDAWPALALALLFVARIGAGIAGATIATAQAVIADCTHAGETQARHGPDRRRLRHRLHLRPADRRASLTLVPASIQGAVGYAAAGAVVARPVLGMRLLPETCARAGDCRPAPALARLARAARGAAHAGLALCR